MKVLHERQEVFCLSEGIRLHEDNSSRPIKLPIPNIFYSSDKVKLEERLNYVVETFKNRDVPSQSRKSKGKEGAVKKAQPSHTATSQSQGEAADPNFRPPNVTNVSAQSTYVKPDHFNFPCTDIRYRYARPGGLQIPSVPERPIRSNIEGQAGPTWGHITRLFPSISKLYRKQL